MRRQWAKASPIRESKVRRILKAKITHISLVPRGANRLPVIYKSDDSTFDLDTLIKADMEKGEVLACVYAPEHRDSQGDIADAETIRSMAHDAARRGLQLDVRHDLKTLTKDQAYPAESFIIQKNDPRFADMKDYNGKAVDVTGGWGVLLKVDDPELRKAYREGKWNGVSMFGSAEVEAETAGSITKLLKGLSDLLGLSPKPTLCKSGDLDMDKAELEKTLDANNKSLAEQIAKSVGDAVVKALSTRDDATLAKAAGVLSTDTPEEAAARITLHKAGKGKAAPAAAAAETAKAKPVFKGDVTNEDDVAAFELEMKKWEITHDIDMSDPAAIRKAQVELAKLDVSDPDDETEDGETVSRHDSPEVRALKQRVAKLSKSSNVGGDGTTTKPAAKTGDISFNGVKLSKEDAESLAIGNRMGAALAAGKIAG